MNTLELTRQLVAIPSARSDTEIGVANLIEKWCHTSLAGWQIERRTVDQDRYNLFVHDGRQIRLLMIGHLDTIDVGDGWTRDPYGELIDGRLYGRGSADMKAGVAVIMSALAHAATNGVSGVGGLFYCDEERGFTGMKKFIEIYGARLHPELVVCPEPTQLGIRAGVRGVVAWKVVINGKRGHAARPTSGANAFRALMAGVRAVDAFCSETSHRYMGQPTVNITGVRCGIVEDTTTHPPRLASPSNVIPDYCEAVLEVRTVPGVTKESIIIPFQQMVEQSGSRVAQAEATVDVGSFWTDRKALARLEDSQREVLGMVQYDDPAKGGYSDVQLLAEQLKVPCVLLGPRGSNMHGPDEFVDNESVATLARIYDVLVDRFGKGDPA